MNGRKILASMVVLAAMSSPLAGQQKPPSKTATHTASASRKATARAAGSSATATYPALVQERPGLLERATVTADAATGTALKGMAGATVTSRKLVERGDKLIYVITLKPKTGGMKEVNVDGKTGAVVPMAPAKPKGS
jgi:uncharacterized membrane protein YkoI